LLRARLSRRGITLSLAGLSTASAAQPAELIAATLQACAASASKPTITILAEVVMHAMWMSKVKIAVGTCLVAAIVGTGTSWVLTPATAQDGAKTPAIQPVIQSPIVQQPALPPWNSEAVPNKEAWDLILKAVATLNTPSPLAAKNPADDPTREMIKERYRTAGRESNLRLQVFTAGARGGTIDVLLGALQRRLESELALSSRPEDQNEARRKNLECLQAIVAVNKARYDVGQIAQQDLEQCKYKVLEAEIRIAESQASERNNKK
jgi:hypothetical protein